jgi:hypothetical protein
MVGKAIGIGINHITESILSNVFTCSYVNAEAKTEYSNYCMWKKSNRIMQILHVSAKEMKLLINSFDHLYELYDISDRQLNKQFVVIFYPMKSADMNEKLKLYKINY